MGKHRKQQLNLTVDEELAGRIEEAVNKFGKDHMAARTRANVGADIVRTFFNAWWDLMEQRDKLLKQQHNIGRVRHYRSATGD